MHKEIEICPLEKEDSLIEKLFYIDCLCHKSPWTYDGIAASFNDNCKVIGIYYKKELVGFSVISIVFDDCELFTIGVIPSCQGLGLGKALMEKSMSYAKELGAKQCFLEVRVSNEVAINMYKSFGFEVNGLRKNYYSKTKDSKAEDAYTMSCVFKSNV